MINIAPMPSRGIVGPSGRSKATPRLSFEPQIPKSDWKDPNYSHAP